MRSPVVPSAHQPSKTPSHLQLGQWGTFCREGCYLCSLWGWLRHLDQWWRHPPSPTPRLALCLRRLRTHKHTERTRVRPDGAVSRCVFHLRLVSFHPRHISTMNKAAHRMITGVNPHTWELRCCKPRVCAQRTHPLPHQMCPQRCR